ncbi:hypothetical protein EVAR_76148_1 [Eumeta japonica]|uniref:Uncharacterized protein n=1 Tax=Eumeta variegata TaxID=151549 RepID=A0A4C1UVZ4_EUMVA|nr:hypothetical protein EVAR_76148_1 [Eumeta japonica]
MEPLHTMEESTVEIRAIFRSSDSPARSSHSGTKNGTQNIAFKRTTYLRAATCDNAAVDSTAESFATTRDTSGSSIDPNAAPDFVDTGLPAAGAAQIAVRATDGGHPCYHG